MTMPKNGKYVDCIFHVEQTGAIANHADLALPSGIALPSS